MRERQLLLFEDRPPERDKAAKDYKSFEAKFVRRRTSDDCYTPPEVYDCVREYVNRRVIPLAGLETERPFWPGGDYERYPYKENGIVIDNPPFSIITPVTRFYERRGIRFFLFAPAISLFGLLKGSREITAVSVCLTITYTNGAAVNTSFVTNVWPGRPMFVIAGDLCAALREVTDRCKEKYRRMAYPPGVVSGTRLGRHSRAGVVLECPRDEAAYAAKLDCGHSNSGGFVLVSKRISGMLAASLAEKEAERAAAAKTYELPLSSAEKRIIGDLGKEEP